VALLTADVIFLFICEEIETVGQTTFRLEKRTVGTHDHMQGCQIFLGTKYQNGEKYTKLP
jgi:hypothetical protein